MEEPIKFGKNNPNDKIYWVQTDNIGDFRFSFDKVVIYNLFGDFHKLTPEQKAIFRKENPTLGELVL